MSAGVNRSTGMPTKVEQGGARQRINQQIEIATFKVSAVQSGAENSQIACPETAHSIAHGTSFKLQDRRGAHQLYPSGFRSIVTD